MLQKYKKTTRNTTTMKKLIESTLVLVDICLLLSLSHAYIFHPHIIKRKTTILSKSVFVYNTRYQTIVLAKQTSLKSSGDDRNEEGDETKKYDLAVIGAGPVGVRAAIVAASSPFYKKVCLIDAPRCSGELMDEENNKDLSIGGPTGLFSKALRDTSKRMKVSTLRGMGLREESIWNEITSVCLDLARTNADDVLRQLSFANVDYLEGLASFTGNANELKIQSCSDGTDPNESIVTRFLKPGKVLIATGSKPFRPNNIPFDGERIFDSDSINGLSYLPKSIAITGSGIIAIEYAKIFRNLGSEVTLIIRDKIPRKALMKIGLDIDIAATLVADLVRSGIHFERNAQVKHFEVPQSGLTNRRRSPIKLHLEGKSGQERQSGRNEIQCDAYLAAVGRVPKIGELNLDALGMLTDEYGGILVNGRMETSVPNIHAAGDVLGRPFLASTGVAQGVAAVDSMFSPETGRTLYECDPTRQDSSLEAILSIDSDLGRTGEQFDPKSLASNPFAFPVGIWSSPEAAYYGLSKQQANELGIEVGEGMALYAECLRGQVFSPNGILKIVFEKPSGRILGVHICGDDACELIHYGMELIRSKRTINDVVNNLYSAVTFHEMYRIAAMAGLDEVGARKRRAAAGVALARRNRSILASADK